MASQGRKLDDNTRRYLERLRGVLSVRRAAQAAQVAKSTAQKYLGKKSP